MSSSGPAQFVTGIVPPLVTPLLDRDTLDVAGLERLIERVIAGGVHGLFMLGTTGEGPNLGSRLQRELVTETCRINAGRLPVIVAITHPAFVESIALARHAADAGADALVVAPPYYFPAGQDELVAYVERLVPELPLPLMLYNIPAMTKLSFGPAVLRRATQLDRVIGLKDSSGELGYFAQALEIARARPDWTVLIGQESLLARAVGMGGHGTVAGGALVDPALLVGLYEAARAGDTARVAALQTRLEKLGAIFGLGPNCSSLMNGVKGALSLLGVCGTAVTEPFTPFGEAERARLRSVLEELGLLG